ncbi:unnamed protein product [Lampetra fluviatilis]
MVQYRGLAHGTSAANKNEEGFEEKRVISFNCTLAQMPHPANSNTAIRAGGGGAQRIMTTSPGDGKRKQLKSLQPAAQQADVKLIKQWADGGPFFFFFPILAKALLI